MNRCGQSIIEYSLIAVLVILGIVTMGPYVLRSVGSHFKIWDDGIGDSFQENLTQAPVGDVPVTNSVCNCWYVNAGCGSASAGSQCKPTESILNLTCSLDSIQGCDVGAPLSMCQPDPVNCCTAWTNIRCGATPTTQPTVPPNDCYVGYELQGHQCGNTTSTQCVLASSLGLTCTAPACTGTISTTDTASGPVNTAAPCPNEPPVSTPLTVTNGISYVQADTQVDCGNALPCTFCNPAQTCQVYCLPGYVLDTTNNPPTGCIPAAPSCGSQSICPSAYKVTSFDSYWNNGSNPGQCASCSTFICSYSIWVAPSNNNNLFVNQLTTYTRTVTLPPGNYYVKYASDDTGSVSVDGAVVCSNTNPGLYTFQNPQNCPFTIPVTPSNSHTITLQDTNLSGNNSSWCWNPAGVAVEVFNSSGVEVSDGNGPIDTSAAEAGKWTSTLACPTGQCWDCTTQQCQAAPVNPSPTTPIWNPMTGGFNYYYVGGGTDSYTPNTSLANNGTLKLAVQTLPNTGGMVNYGNLNLPSTVPVTVPLTFLQSSSAQTGVKGIQITNTFSNPTPLPQIGGNIVESVFFGESPNYDGQREYGIAFYTSNNSIYAYWSTNTNITNDPNPANNMKEGQYQLTGLSANVQYTFEMYPVSMGANSCGFQVNVYQNGTLLTPPIPVLGVTNYGPNGVLDNGILTSDPTYCQVLIGGAKGYISANIVPDPAITCNSTCGTNNSCCSLPAGLYHKLQQVSIGQ